MTSYNIHVCSIENDFYDYRRFIGQTLHIKGANADVDIPILDYEPSYDIMDRLEGGDVASLCRDKIGESYIRKSLRHNELVYVVVVSLKSTDTIVGFATLRVNEFIQEHNERSTERFVIDVLCTTEGYRGIGSMIMRVVYKLGALVGIEYIQLSAVTEALGFYLKMGFKCDPLCKMMRTIPASNEEE